MHFYKLIIDVTQKGYNYPIKIKIALAKIFSWFGIIIIPRFDRKCNRKLKKSKSFVSPRRKKGFVLDFCPMFRIFYFVTSGKNFRSPFTKQLPGVFCELRSNPCLYSRIIRGVFRSQTSGRFARSTHDKRACRSPSGECEPSCACAQTDFEKYKECHNPSLCVPNFRKIRRFFRFSSAHLSDLSEK